MQTEQAVYFWTFIKLKIERHWFFIKNASVPFKKHANQNRVSFTLLKRPSIKKL